MLALVAAVAALIALIVAMLAVPLVLFIEAERTGTLKVRWRVFWLFGLVRPRSRNRRAPPVPDRADARLAGTTTKRRARRRRVAAAVLRTRGLLQEVVRLALALLRRMKVERIQVDTLFGFENPADTGFVYRMPLAGASDRQRPGTEHPVPSDVPGGGCTRSVPRDNPCASALDCGTDGRVPRVPSGFSRSPHGVANQEMTERRSETRVTVTTSGLEIETIESIVVRVERVGDGIVGLAVKQPISIVVRSPAGTLTLDLQSEDEV